MVTNLLECEAAEKRKWARKSESVGTCTLGQKSRMHEPSIHIHRIFLLQVVSNSRSAEAREESEEDVCGGVEGNERKGKQNLPPRALLHAAEERNPRGNFVF